MNFSSLHFSKNIGVVVVVGALVLAGISYLFFRNDTPEGVVSIAGAPTSQSEATFVTLAGQLDSIVFNTDILSDPRFTSLRDIHTAVFPEATGRTDPFAPLGQR